MSFITHATPRPRLLLPRISRLRSGHQHLRVRTAGRHLHGSLIRMGVLSGSETGTQGAVVVSRRVGPAVVRNRVKRRLREIYRGVLPSLAPGLWIVVTAKPAAAGAGMEDLRSEWLRLGKRLSIFTGS